MLNRYILTYTLGALCLAAIYHTALYIQRRESILRFYSLYLWTLVFYLLYRFLFEPEDGTYYFDALSISIAVDTCYMMGSYIAYILFWGQAMMLNKKDASFIWGYYKYTPPIIVSYIIWDNIHVNLFAPSTISTIVWVGIRIYIACFGLLAVFYALKQRKNPYYYFLTGGIVSIVFTGLFSMYISARTPEKLWGISPFSWIMFGYFLDVIFFSAAIGYRLKTEANERLTALTKVLEQQQIIQQNELKSLKATYQAREEERSRIATELHDDLGSSLSTIRILSETNKSTTNPSQDGNLQKISSHTKELLQKMSEIVWALNIKDDLLPPLIAYIRSQSAKMLEEAQLDYSFHISDSIPDIHVIGSNRRHLQLLVKEAVHNIIKHANASHTAVTILVDENLTITIYDNGIGMPKDKLQNTTGNGLANMRKHAEALGGQVSVEHQNGTLVHFSGRLQNLSHESGI